MKNSLTIAGKELAGYFLQPVAYVVMTVFLLLGGFFFFALLRYFEVTLTAYAAMQNPEVLQKLNLNERVIDAAAAQPRRSCSSSWCLRSRCEVLPRKSAPAPTSCC